MHAPPCTFTRWVLLIVATLMVGMLPACGTASPSPSSITIVATATAAEPRPSLPDGVRAALVSMAKASKGEGQATVRLITTADTPAIAEDLTPLRPNGQVQHATADADRQIGQAVDRVAAQLHNAASPVSGFGLLPLLDLAGQMPHSAIHVLSSGATTDEPTAFQRLGFGADPVAVVDSIEQQGGLPNLSGHDVTFHGLGSAAGSQPRFQPAERAALERFWLTVCQRAHGDSCTVAREAPTDEPPLAALPVPVVPVAIITTADGCPVSATFSDADTALRFGPDSDVVPQGADATLRPLVDTVSRCHIERIDIDGYIADTGNGDTRDNLAGRRARAVADALLALGLPPGVLGSVTGKGASNPVVPNFTNGRFDETKAEQNRRVELVFTRPVAR